MESLERDSKGKPKITLNPLEKTAVHTPTQKEYKTLIQVYECGGWIWGLKDLPTQHNYWRKYKEKTCISAQHKFGFGTAGVGFKEEDILSTQKFYDIQNITQEKIKEINKWFKKHRKLRFFLH